MRTSCKSFLAALCLLFGSGVASANVIRAMAGQSLSVNEKESYAVYSALINGQYQGIKHLVIADETVPTSLKEFPIKDRMPELEQATLDDFLANNKNVQKLSAKFSLSAKYILVSDKDLSEIFQATQSTGFEGLEQKWARFYDKYPASNGIINFSRVGFNATQKQALIYTGKVCGPLCGLGQCVLFEKIDGIWAIKRVQAIWVS